LSHHVILALSIFNEISSHPSAAKQIPAVHYHLGSLRAMLWGYEIRQPLDTADFASRLELNLVRSMEHYRYCSLCLFKLMCSLFSHAHTYFLKYDVGPTLVLINTEMAEMYLHSFHLRESGLAKELQILKESSSSMDAMGRESLSSIFTIREFVSSLLGGAYRVLVDCRFALTGVVLERHGLSMIDGGLVKTIVRLLTNLILKLLKYLSSQAYRRLDESPEEQSRGLRLLKEVYSEALTASEWSHTPAAAGAAKESSKKETTTPLRREVRSLYDMLDKLNSCEWLKSNL
jgi:hypothetical protein